jgi:methylmalonyl-CoA mutase cobalamin-binding subunit
MLRIFACVFERLSQVVFDGVENGVRKRVFLIMVGLNTHAARNVVHRKRTPEAGFEPHSPPSATGWWR